MSAVTNNKKTLINITVTFDADLDIESLWPDGDAPEHPTIADVQKVIDRDGGIERVLHDWNLDQDPDVVITITNP